MTSVIISFIRIYQSLFSPDHGGILSSQSFRCRFYPSCSEYAIRALGQYGLLRGSVASLFRILRCNPLNCGGYDPIDRGRHIRI